LKFLLEFVAYNLEHVAHATIEVFGGILGIFEAANFEESPVAIIILIFSPSFLLPLLLQV